MEIKRGELYYVDLKPTRGSEMKKRRRPCVVVSSNAINKAARVIIICPITDSYNKFSPIHIKISAGTGGLKIESVVHCGQVRSIDKSRIGSKLGKFESHIMEEISRGLNLALTL